MSANDTTLHRVLLTTGGTGGHVFPALAVAEELRRRNPEVQLLFVGSHYGPEAGMVRAAGVEFKGLPVRGFLGRGLRGIAAGARMTQALLMATWIVRRFKPQIAVSFGSYAGFAPLLAARLQGIPTALHEQNAVAGVSNKILGKLCDKICVSLKDTQGFPAEKCVLTGNPVRRDVLAAVSAGSAASGTESGAPSGPGSACRKLLIMGGSLGASALNQCIVQALPLLHESGVELLHQTGAQDCDAVQKAYAAAGYSPECAKAFIEDMGAAYAWADLVLCRAGATTVAELAAAGKAAVLVPFPHAIHDHQSCNARILAHAGAAVLVQEADMLHVDLPMLLLRLLNDKASLEAMRMAARQQARPQAASCLVDELEILSKG